MKGCLCDDGLHRKSWHCIINTDKLPATFLADFPFNRPATYGTGLWARKEFHKIRDWGKSH